MGIRVPTDEYWPTVQPQGQLAYQNIYAGPASFGAQAGQAIQGLGRTGDAVGNMLAQHAVQRQQLINETNVNDVYSNQFSPQLKTITQNYMKLEGKDAEARFPEFQQQMSNLRTEARSNLSNPMQQKAFDEMSTRRVEADLDGMARHAAAQTKAWQWNTHTAMIGDLTAEAEANYNDPRRLKEITDRLDNATAKYADDHGWSDEVFEYHLHQNNDRLWSAVIKRRALTDPEGALATYRHASSLKRLSGEAQAELEKALKPHIDLFNAQNAYNAVTGQATAQQIAGEALRQGVDPSTALTIWSAEGGVTNPAAQNPDSSATGIFQHTAGTWADLGGADRDRTDGRKQVELGVALTKQNSAALTKDLGRRPQPWEIYLAHQQGLTGATALIHSDPNANACEVIGNPEAITLNGGTPDMSAGQFLNYIKDYTDKHSMMYTPNGTPTARNLSDNYDQHLKLLADQAQGDFPGDPAAVDRYQIHYGQQAGSAIQAEKITNRANWNIVNNAMIGPRAFQSKAEFLADPATKAAYDAIYAKDRSVADMVDNVYYKKNLGLWNPPATPQTDQFYDNLNGMQYTDRDSFANLNLMQYYGGMPVSQLDQLMCDQNKIRNHDETQAAKLANLNSSITAVKDLTSLAAASAESPFYKMDDSSPFPPDQQKWNGFVSKFAQVFDDWQHNNSGKVPTDMQKREIAQTILFPSPPSPPAPVAPSFHGGALPPEISSKYEAIIKSEPGGYPATPANIKALYDQDQAREAK